MAKPNDNDYHLSTEELLILNNLKTNSEIPEETRFTLRKATYLAVKYSDDRKETNEKIEEQRKTIGELSDRINLLTLNNEAFKIKSQEEKDKIQNDLQEILKKKNVKIEVLRKKNGELMKTKSEVNFASARHCQYIGGNYSNDEEVKSKLESANAEIKEKNEIIKEKDEVIKRKDEEIMKLKTEIDRLREENGNNLNEITSLQEQLTCLSLTPLEQETS